MSRLDAKPGSTIPSNSLSAANGKEPPIESYSYDGFEGRIVRNVLRIDGSRTQSAVTAGTREAAWVASDLRAAFDQSWLQAPSAPLAAGADGSVRIADLFSGCGGMTAGVVEACRAIGLEANPIYALDADRASLEVYSDNFSPTRVEEQPIQSILNGDLGAPPTREERLLMNRVGEVDLVLAGPPCQGHSDLNNKTRRIDPKNELFIKVARFVELFEPNHVIVENVEGILHDKANVFGRTRNYFEKDLFDFGYSVDAAKLEAQQLGVAQNRHRIFLVASRLKQVDIKGFIRPFMTHPRSFSWACGDLKAEEVSDDPFNAASKPSAVNRERIAYLFKHERHNLPDHERPPCHKDKPHSYQSVYGRMWNHRPAPTITTGFTSMGQGRFVHPTEQRTITPHEAARLQFFPDFFRFGSQNRTTLKRLIGNAVPPKLTYVLAVQLMR